jgi:hypothetical protein
MNITAQTETRKKRGRPKKTVSQVEVSAQAPISMTPAAQNESRCCGKGCCSSKNNEQTFLGKVKDFLKRLASII